jgi:serine/threonine protein kinase
VYAGRRLSDAPVQAGPDSGAHHRRLGPYTVLEKLPAYGMVQPYVARRDGAVDLLILKRLLLELSGNVTARSRFRREAALAQHLRHPNVVIAQDVGEDQDVFFLVTEWVRGVSLHAVQARLQGRPVPLPVFRAVALAVLDGIGYAHAATSREGLPLDIVHRDLAPRSLLLSFSGEVKINDFGVARARVDDFKTLPGIAVGSVPYFSPEQAQGRGLDRRSDLYTLGVVFYELLTGRRAVREDGMLAMLRAVVGEEPPPLASVRPDLDPPLVQAIQRALAKDPDERWSDAVAFRAAVAAALPPARGEVELVSRFVRQLFPDREAETIALVDRIREHAEELGTPTQVVPVPLDDRPEREKATQVVRSRRRQEDEPPEPSVMTMPGAPVPSQPDGPALVQLPRPARRGPPVGLLVAAGAVAAACLAAALWVTLRAAPVVPVTLSVPAAAQATPEVQPEVSAEPESAPAPAASSARPAPRLAPVRTEPVRPEAPRPPSPEARSVAGGGGPAPAVPTPAPAPEASEDPEARALRLQLQALRRNPKDVLAFEQVLASLRRAAQALPPADARAVRAALDAAERSFELDELLKAHARLRQAQR